MLQSGWRACQGKNLGPWGGIRLREVGPAQPAATLRQRMWRSRTELDRALDPDGLGWHVGEQVRAAARRRRPGRAGPLGWELQVGEDLADDPGVLDGRDQAHVAAAARAGQDIHIEGAPHEVSPGPIAGWGGSLRLQLHDAARARVNSACFHQRGLRALVGHGAGTPAGVGGENAMVEHEIDARPRSQGGEPFEEFQGLKEEVAGAIVPGALELQQDAAVAREPEAILGDRRSQEVAAELLEPRTIFCWDEQVRVEIEALKMGLTGPGRGHPGGIGVASEAKDASAGPSPEGDAPLATSGSSPLIS